MSKSIFNMESTQPFIKLMQSSIYTNMYLSLLEMKADKEILEAAEAYKEAPLPVLMEGVQWVQTWQQAKAAELIKNAYIEECNRKKREIWQRRYEKAMQQKENKKFLN